ncbi:MAG: penicillin-binding transpeptidase domain-containing protein [Cellulosilyticaceae bacterium]
MKSNFNKVLRFVTDRIFIVVIAVVLMFSVLVGQFYKLQIIEHDSYANNLRASIERNIEIPATRGRIFDRYGRPLAINQATNVLKFDQQVRLKKGELNKILLNVAEVLEENGDIAIDNMPITVSEPFEFTGTKTQVNQFLYNVPYNDAAHREELVQKTASELIDYLRSDKVFDIDETYTSEEARKIIPMRLEIFPYTYRKYNQVTLATNISQETVMKIEESYADFPGVLVDVEPVRYYTEGEIFGNVLGYTRAITGSQYEELKADGYDKNDIVGHEGIEKSMESELRGSKGMERVEVDNLGRKVHTIENQNAIAGNDVYLTIDLDLQRETYLSTERNLSAALCDRLRGNKQGVGPLASKEIIVSMLESSQLSYNELKTAEEGTMQKNIYQKLIKMYDELDDIIKNTITPLDLLIQNLEENTGSFTEREVLLALNEQGKVKLGSETVKNLTSNLSGTCESILIDQLEKGTLKPNQFAVDPFSASAVMLDVNTGEVLALVGYPSFDSNEMTTNFNAYYNTLFDDRSMLWNRAVMTREAPGSTFKMITSIAGLEEGVVDAKTTIYEGTGIYEKAGSPGPKCWIHSLTGGGHGTVDLVRGLEVSCNYYFFDVAFRLGLLSSEPYYGIDMLTKYSEMFGLGSPTGIEIAETEPNISSPKNLVKNQLTPVLNGLKNLSDENLMKYTEAVTNELNKGLYPIIAAKGDTVEEQVDYMTQHEIKRQIEPSLQDAFEDSITEILNEIYLKLKNKLELTVKQSINQIVEGTMNDPSTRSLKAKTKDQVVNLLRTFVENEITELVKPIIQKIDLYDILDAYEYAYDIVYSRELKKNGDENIIAFLRERLEKIEEEEDRYREHLTSKIKESILQTIANQCLMNLELEWSEGTTIRTAIGQGSNAFTPTQIARYIAAIANGETVYNVRLINGIFDVKNTKTYKPKESTIYGTLDLKETTIPLIHEGMYKVSKGSSGSARNEFKNYEIPVASKTGTAQKGGREHSWFVGFAPFDKPEVAFVTTMYYADSLGSYSRLLARDMLTEYFGLNKETTKTTLDNIFVD